MSDIDLLETVKPVVEAELAPVKVSRVSISEDVDDEGDRIFRIVVVLESDRRKLDPKKVVGLARHLREPLARIHRTGFPVFSFVTQDELDGEAA
ncbi:hypothetical protein [Meinhardsimonia xiamenensis]|jgi:hypothetical protein|uniref:hypothetical protein n=1 Tax=Meinhardsimonia xiamenensis TaxID=990712 RepID=UPI00115F7BF8|nr:hypothetical protein [Meinhardsimonia xiamenensis]